MRPFSSVLPALALAAALLLSACATDGTTSMIRSAPVMASFTSVVVCGIATWPWTMPRASMPPRSESAMPTCRKPSAVAVAVRYLGHDHDDVGDRAVRGPQL